MLATSLATILAARVDKVGFLILPETEHQNLPSNHGRGSDPEVFDQ